MCKDKKFFICKHCGNIIGFIQNKGVPVVCCGEKMTELVANSVEASNEKHLPAVNVQGDKVSVSVGSVLHPMEEEHHIVFIYIETEKGNQFKCLEVGKSPVAEFSLVDDEVVAVYEYCNLHGLWKIKV